MHHDLKQEREHRRPGQTNAFLFEAPQIDPDLFGRMKAGPPRPQARRSPAVVPVVFSKAQFQRMLFGSNHDKTIDGEDSENSDAKGNASQKTRERERVAEAPKIEWVSANRIRPLGLQFAILA